MSKNQKLLGGMVLANTGVFLLWMIPAVRHSKRFHRLFVSSPFSGKLSLVLSSFSHQHILHLSFNMLALYSFGDGAGQGMTPSQLLAVCLTGAAFSSYLAVAINTLRGAFRPSLGASSFIYSLFTIVALKEPDARVHIAVIPQVDFNIQNALLFLLGADLLSLLIWHGSPLNHAAHLSGALFGYLYWNHGRALLAEHQPKVVAGWKAFKAHRYIVELRAKYKEHKQQAKEWLENKFGKRG
eukprot:Colp12_sorted_trinity150504_noHs@9679